MTTLASGPGIAGVMPRSGLQFSDYCYLLAVAIAALVAIDPGRTAALDSTSLSDNSLIKHLALPISVLAVLLAVIGRKLRAPLRRESTLAPLLSAAWPLVALAVLIISGSFYARLFDGIQNTFLFAGIYMLAGILIAGMMVQHSHAPEALVRGYFRVLVAAAIAASIVIIMRQGYHELIFFVIPMAAYFFLGSRRGPVRWLGLAFFLSMALFSNKNTSFLVALLTAAYIVLTVMFARLQGRPVLDRITTVYWVVTLGIAGATIIGLLALHTATHMPTGNPEYRLHAYGLAWERFLESPVWGMLFTAEAVEKFTLFEIAAGTQVLPTHSDVLDLLAHGGIIAVTLWLIGLVRAWRIARRSVLRTQHFNDRWAPYVHTLALMSLAAVIVYAFNPIFLQSGKAYLVWSNLGMLLGLSLRAREGLHKRDMASQGGAPERARTS